MCLYTFIYYYLLGILNIYNTPSSYCTEHTIVLGISVITVEVKWMGQSTEGGQLQ